MWASIVKYCVHIKIGNGEIQLTPEITLIVGTFYMQNLKYFVKFHYAFLCISVVLVIIITFTLLLISIQCRRSILNKLYEMYV